MSTFNVWFGEQTLIVHATYSPGKPGVHTLPNGDPGYPDDPPECEIERVELCVEVADDLTPDADAKRPVHIDVTEFLLALNCLGEGPLTDVIWDEAAERYAAEADDEAAARWEDQRSWEGV